MLRYRPAALISPTTIASASRSVSSRSLGDFAEAADGQARAGERVPPDDFLGQAELQAELADFVLEQVAQRLDQLEAELRRQAADVVVQLDRVGRAVERRRRFRSRRDRACPGPGTWRP